MLYVVPIRAHFSRRGRDTRQYARRPRTCRTYDCVFAASGLLFDDPAKSAVDEQISRWQFRLPEAIDRIELQAVRRTTALLEEQEPGLGVTERTLAALGLYGRLPVPDSEQDEEEPEAGTDYSSSFQCSRLKRRPNRAVSDGPSS
jgi:hypothetical protein